ncbi:MAG: shikimate dehydrogenase [Candidatus Omnitrophota bacterium]
MDHGGVKQRYGLIGYPVKHSFSAAMHNAAFAHLGMNAQYELFEVKPYELHDFLISLRDQGVLGVNITIPYKEKVVTFLDDASIEVNEIGATNTLVVDNNGKLKGFNTDSAGFAFHIAKLGVKVSHTAIIGAGGAAKAVAMALLKNGAREIAIYDIDQKKSLELVNRVKRINFQCNAYMVESIQELQIKDKNFVVNTTPVGMKKEDPCLLEKNMIHPELFIYDVIYNPPVTKMLELAKNNGVQFSNGLRMLLYQGMLAFEQWTGKPAPEKVMFEALQKEVGKCQNS